MSALGKLYKKKKKNQNTVMGVIFPISWKVLRTEKKRQVPGKQKARSKKFNYLEVQMS